MKFNYSSIEPLDGSPMMSANCWNTILEAFDKHSSDNKIPSVLEWGAGNSTVNLVRRSINKNYGLNLVSVEHESNFYHWLAESVLSELLQSGDTKNLKMEWQTLVSNSVSIKDISKYFSRHKKLEASSIDLQIVLNSKRLSYLEQIRPNLEFNFFKIVRNIFKLFLLRLTYLQWLLRGIRRHLLEGKKDTLHILSTPKLSLHNDEVKKGLFFNFFENNPEAGCLTLIRGNIKIKLWHLPPTASIFLKKRVILEGSIKQLTDYVEVPVEGKFNIIFIDGRSRVSCINRVNHDVLLELGGDLFVHDAFRTEMFEAFVPFQNSCAFISGSNVTLSGLKRCPPGSGLPLARTGKDNGLLEEVIIQELFLFQNR